MSHYGSIREALALGPPPVTSTENESQRNGDWIETTWRPSPSVVTANDDNTFWNSVYSGSAATNDLDLDTLRTQVVTNARVNMRAELARRKACPNRVRVEQRLLDQWRRAAAPTMNETPRLGRATPDHLQSPFNRF